MVFVDYNGSHFETKVSPSYDNIYIIPDEHDKITIGEKIKEVEIDHYIIYGVVPISCQQYGIFECCIDYFVDLWETL